MSNPPSPRSLRVAVLPDTAVSWMRDAVVDGGGELVDVADTTALVWGAAVILEVWRAFSTPTPNWSGSNFRSLVSRSSRI